MSESSKAAAHHSSPRPSAIHFFRASLLCLSLVSTIYVHPSSSLPFVSALAFSFSFLFPNITFMYRKRGSHERSTQTKTKHDQDEILPREVLQNEDGKVHGGSKIRSCANYSPTPCPDLGSSSSLCDEMLISADMDEDYVIEITLPEKMACLQDSKRHTLAEPVFLQHGLEDSLSDVDEFITGEDRLIEIDISMGSIRH